MKKRALKLKLIRTVIILILLAVPVTFIAVKISANKTEFVLRDPYDKTGYKLVSEYEEGHVFTINNDRFTLNLDAKTTKFELIDNDTNQTWYSNPEKVSENNYPKEFEELYTVYYEMLLESPKGISVVEKSVQLGHQKFKEIENGIDVLYEIGRDERLTVYDLPYQVTSEHYHDLIINPLKELIDTGEVTRRQIVALENSYMYIEESDSYLILTSKFNTADSINQTYDLIFGKSDYTREDFEEDRDLFGFPSADEKPYFEFVVRYTLTEEGFNVQILNESIFESELFQIAYIDVLPYFGSNNLNDEGITVIPDGSGVLINHTSGNYVGSIYEKRIYGSDLSIAATNNLKPESNSTIKMPMYGYTKNNNGFINVLESSDTMASIRAGYRTTSSSGTYTNIVPWVHYRYHLRERDGFTFQTWNSQQRVSVWTKKYNQDDFVANYIFTSPETTEVDYYELAILYKEYLVNKYNLQQKEYNDIIHLTMLGGYKKQKHFLGFPYDRIRSLTNADQILEILDLIDSKGSSIDVGYLGWSNEGIKANSMDKIKFDNNVITKKELNKLNETFEEDNNRLFLEFFTQTAYTDKNLNIAKDVVRDLFQESVKFSDYDEAMQIAYKNRMPQYQLSIEKQNSIYKTINKANYTSNVIIGDEAQLLASNFGNKNLTLRDEVLENTINNINSLNKTVALRNANQYGVLSSDKVIDLPVVGGQNRVTDYSIPFIQLVYNGYFNYTSPSANLDTSKTVKWHMLKAIETGSKMHFTLSYNDTVDLIKSQYSHFYSTYYNNWIFNINSVISELSGYGIYNSNIVDHKTLNIQGTIVEVTYDNGKKFTINYDTETIVESSVII